MLVPRYSVALNAGHCFEQGANRGPTTYEEAVGNLRVARSAQYYLTQAGVSVELTRWTSGGLYTKTPWSMTGEIEARLMKVLLYDPTVYVEIHSDAAVDPTAHGTTVYLAEGWKDSSLKLGSDVLYALTYNLSTASRGVRTSNNYSLLKKVQEAGIPSILVESMFHTNHAEERRLLTDEGTDAIGRAIAVGVFKYLGTKQWPAVLWTPQALYQKLEETKSTLTKLVGGLMIFGPPA